jgi:hypothetical protein
LFRRDMIGAHRSTGPPAHDDCSVCLHLFGDNHENRIKVDLSDFAESLVSRSLTVRCERPFASSGKSSFTSLERAPLSLTDGVPCPSGFSPTNKHRLARCCLLCPVSICSRIVTLGRAKVPTGSYRSPDTLLRCRPVCKCQNRKDVCLSEAGSCDAYAHTQ